MRRDLPSPVAPSLIEEELQRFRGVWTQVAYERDGIKEPLDEQGWQRRTMFTDTEFPVTLAGGSIPIRNEALLRRCPAFAPAAGRQYHWPHEPRW